MKTKTPKELVDELLKLPLNADNEPYLSDIEEVTGELGLKNIRIIQELVQRIKG